MNDVVFSIVMPTYNRPELLKRAMRSVLNQTFQNFELVVVDDASERRTADLARSFRDDRIVYVCHESNLGASAAYNSGIARSTGLFIAFLDDDDEYFPDFLIKAYRFVESTSPPVDFFWTGVRHVRDMPGREEIWFEKNWRDGFESLEKAYIEATTIGNGFGLVVKREVFDEIGMFDERLQVCEDTDFLFRLVQKREFSVLPEVLVKIHRHGGAQLVDPDKYRVRARAVETIMERYRSFIEQYPGLHEIFARHLVDLHYRAGDRRRGRQCIRDVIRPSPYRPIYWIDWICYEFFGRDAAFCFTKKRLRRAVEKLLPEGDVHGQNRS